MHAMRNPILACVLPLCVLCAAGCGDDTTNAGPDMSMPDLAVGPDMAMRTPDGVVCGSMTCPVGQSCCVQASGMVASAMCGTGGQCNGGALLACDGPEDCGGGTASGQFCCGTVKFTAGMGPDAGAPMFQGGDAMCATSCNFNFGQGMLTTRLCHQDVDCTGLTGPLGTQLDKCCSSAQAPGLHFCATTFPGLPVTCP